MGNYIIARISNRTMSHGQRAEPLKLVIPELGIEPMNSDDEVHLPRSSSATECLPSDTQRDMQESTHRLLYDLAILYDSSGADAAEYSTEEMVVSQENYSLSRRAGLAESLGVNLRKPKERKSPWLFKKRVKQHCCKHCKYKTTRKYELACHEQIHMGKKVIKCLYCDFKGKTHRDVSKHEKTHDVEKPYTCKYCDYQARFRSDLLTHTITHNVDKRYKCQYCSYRSSRETSLVFHQRIHFKQKE